MTTITTERLTKILSETQAVITECNSRCVHGSVEVNARLFENVLMELLRHRAALLQGSQPVSNRDELPDVVGWIRSDYHSDYRMGDAPIFILGRIDPSDAWGVKYIPLTGNYPAVRKREQVRREHAEWSDATFGNVGPVGPLKHLSKEALEAAANPEDPLEWADMQFLLWDAQRRMGLSDDFITRAMIEKLEINRSRQWPEPKDGEPSLHIKSDQRQEHM
ncbi:DUF550 domain-containing protein [Citrobacter amalonaticus]